LLLKFFLNQFPLQFDSRIVLIQPIKFNIQDEQAENGYKFSSSLLMRLYKI